MITAQILTFNNEKTIKTTLDCLKNIPVLVSDGGSSDKTLDICKHYNCFILKHKVKNRSHTRNELSEKSKTDWQIYLNPGETIIQGSLDQDFQGNSVQVEVMNGDIITKQIRIWRKKLFFINPVCEKIYDENPSTADLIIWQDEEEIDIEAVKNWQKTDPLAAEPYYYQAFDNLKNKKYQEFVSLAEYYLFKKSGTVAAEMLRYYMAMVHCYTNELNKAIKENLICLSENPLMAEFWCLLGDIYMQGKEFDKAIVFYENAIELGAFRLRTDKWPMQISKYDEYPKLMIEKCRQNKQQTVKLIYPTRLQ